MRVGGSARAAREGGIWEACVAVELRLDITENWGFSLGLRLVVFVYIFKQKIG